MVKKYICFLLIICLLFLCSCTKKQPEPVTDTDFSSDTQSDIIQDSDKSIGNRIYICGFEDFTGPFYEDGSNDIVNSVMGVIIENRSDIDYQIFNFNIVIDGEIYEFESTTLLQNTKMLVLEKNKKSYTDSDNITSCNIVSAGEFLTKPSMYPDIFAVQTGDGEINVTDKTENPLHNVYVYYKNISEDGVYIGGITYRVHYPQLNPGMVKQFITDNFSEKYSKAVFITYDEMHQNG